MLASTTPHHREANRHNLQCTNQRVAMVPKHFTLYAGKTGVTISSMPYQWIDIFQKGCKVCFLQWSLGYRDHWRKRTLQSVWKISVHCDALQPSGGTSHLPARDEDIVQQYSRLCGCLYGWPGHLQYPWTYHLTLLWEILERLLTASFTV